MGKIIYSCDFEKIVSPLAIITPIYKVVVYVFHLNRKINTLITKKNKRAHADK